MLRATKLRMKYGCWGSNSPEEIDQIYLYGYGWYKKDVLHDFLKENPKSIVVNIPPYPYLIPEISSRGEKYVRSNPNRYQHDDLMDLPRE